MTPTPQELIDCLKSATPEQLREILNILLVAWMWHTPSPGYTPPSPPPQPQPAPFVPPYPWPYTPIYPASPEYLPPWQVTNFSGAHQQ